MMSTFAFPDRTLETAIIYADDVEVDRVASDTLEYSGDINGVISVAYTDGTTTTEPITITTFEQKVINSVNNKTSNALTDDEIINLIDSSRRDIIIELCKYDYGYELIWIKDEYYKLPNRWFFDYNGGGEISTYDIEFYTQTIPVYEFTTKEPINVVAMNARDRWVKFDSKLPSNKIVKCNYYATQRDLTQIDFIELLSLRIIYNYHQSVYMSISSTIASDADKIKVGDISIEKSSNNSSKNYTIDKINQTNAEYAKRIEKFKKGFYRVH